MKKCYFFLFALLFTIIQLIFPSHAQAQSTLSWQNINPACVGKDSSENDVATLVGFECIATNILAIGTSAVGVGAFIMLLVGAFLYLTSGGNPKGTEAAQKTISSAVIGIVIAISGIIIINFIASFTGVSGIKKFQIDLDSSQNTPSNSGSVNF